jgi:hypothetical protein
MCTHKQLHESKQEDVTHTQEVVYQDPCRNVQMHATCITLLLAKASGRQVLPWADTPFRA